MTEARASGSKHSKDQKQGLGPSRGTRGRARYQRFLAALRISSSNSARFRPEGAPLLVVGAQDFSDALDRGASDFELGKLHGVSDFPRIQESQVLLGPFLRIRR